MFHRKKDLNTVEYNSLQKKDPLFMTKSIFFPSKNIMKIVLDDYYTDAALLRDEIVKYIRNEKHLYCEAIDLNHFLIDGKRYVLNVERGSKGMDEEWVSQLICLYLEE